MVEVIAFRVYRSGLVDMCSFEQLGSPATIINLRMGPDNMYFVGDSVNVCLLLVSGDDGD